MDTHKRTARPPLDERQRGELEQIFDSVTEGISQIDRNGRILRINKQAERFGKGHIRPGMHLLESFRLLKSRTEDGKAVTRNAQLPTYRALRYGELQRDLVYIMTTPVTRKKRYVSCAAAPIRDSKGRIHSAALHLTDITAQKESEKQIQDFTQLLSETISAQNQEAREFIYGITHDLKSPLVTLQGFLKQIHARHRRLLPTDAQQQLDILLGAAERLWKMVDGLLRFSHVAEESDASTLCKQHGVILKILRDQAHSIRESQAQIKLDKLPAAYVSESHSYQIWANLISNAIRYRKPRRRPRIHVGYDAPSGAYFVKDNGMGIDPKFHRHIFKIFAHFGGHADATGIGLSHVKKIVEAVGGKIWFKSKLGKGSCFYVKLATA